MKGKICQLINGLCILILLAGLAPVAQAQAPLPQEQKVNSQTPPAGYQPVPASFGIHSTHRSSQVAPVLLMMDVLPWNSSAVQTLLTAKGIAFDIAGSAQLSSLDLNPYQVVIILSDQTQAFYNAYKANLTKFEEYVKGGGYLEFHAASGGWNGGSLVGINLPGAGTIYRAVKEWNWIVQPSHALVADLPNPFAGSAASNTFFSFISPQAQVIATNGNVPGGNPVLIEYPLGAGKVIATGQTLEFSYDWGWDTGKILENAINLILHQLDSNIYISPISQQGNADAGNSVVYPFKVVNTTGITGTFNLAISGNTWPVELSTTQTASLPHLAAETVSMTVTIPAGVVPASFDEATLTATASFNSTFTNSAKARTTVLSGEYGYVTGGGNTAEIAVVDRFLGKVVKRLAPWGRGFIPTRNTLSPDGSQLYVTGSTSPGPQATNSDPVPDIAVIDTATQTLLGGVLVGGSPYKVAFTTSGTYALVASQANATVSIINTATRQVSVTLPTGTNPQHIAIHPCQELAYVAATGSGEIDIIDTRALTVTGVITGFSSPLDAVVSPFGHQLYVSEGQTNNIAVVDLSSNQILDRWSVSGHELTSIDISPDGRLLYIADGAGGSVYALDALTGSLLQTIPVDIDTGAGGSSTDVEFAPAAFGPVAFATAFYSQQVVQINTLTHTTVHHMDAGMYALDLAYFRAPATCRAAPLLSPEHQIQFGHPGDTLAFPQRIDNLSGQALSFDLELLGAGWQSTLSATNTGLLDPGASFVFTVTVQVPAAAQPGDRQTLKLQAISDAFAANAELVAAVARPGFIFTPNNGQVQIVDTLAHVATGKAIELGAWGDYPWRGGLSPDGQALYTSLRNSGAVAVIQLSSPSTPTLIPVGDQPNDIAFTSAGDKALVANRNSNTLSVIDTQTLKVTQTITGLLNGPQSIAANACQNKIYVTNIGGDAVTVLDGSTLKVLKVLTSPEFNAPWGIALSPLDHRAYVSNSGNGAITVIDTNSDTVIVNWQLNYPTGTPANLDISPDGSKLYVAGSGNGWLQVVSTETGQVTAEIFTGNGGEGGMGWDVQFFPYPYEAFAYATSPDSNKAVVIDTSTDQVVKTITSPGGGPRGLALFPQPTWCGALPSGSFEQSAGQILVNESVAFTATVTAGIPAPSVSWDFGDGARSSNALNVTHTYTQTGEYGMGLVLENLFSTIVIPGTVLVGEVPAGSFTQSAMEIRPGESVMFTATVSAGFPAPTLTWNFGDGLPVSHEPNPQHTFSKVGAYPVTLTLKNQFGQVALHGTVTVQNPKLHLPLIMTKKP